MAAQALARTGFPPGRITSIDALRGFDMIWILGLDEVLYALKASYPGPLTNFMAAQVTHADWAGLSPYDLIFPLFVFIAGVSLVFSLGKIMQTRGKGPALRRLLVRSALLYLLGILYYVSFLPPGSIRLLGVLQRIALCYLFSGLLFIAFKWRGLAVACVTLLVGYWALMTFVPVPNIGAGHYSEGMNLANYIDKHYLPLYKWDGDHDPEGLLSTLPAIGTCILGTFAGLLLKKEDLPPQKKAFLLCGAGLLSLILGYLWGVQFPIIKKIWTSSYVLVSAGYSALLLALFYQVMEIWQLKRWAGPFIWVGSNAILLYLGFSLLRLTDIGGSLSSLLPRRPGEVLGPAIAASLSLLLAFILYRKKIFIRI